MKKEAYEVQAEENDLSEEIFHENITELKTQEIQHSRTSEIVDLVSETEDETAINSKYVDSKPGNKRSSSSTTSESDENWLTSSDKKKKKSLKQLSLFTSFNKK